VLPLHQRAGELELCLAHLRHVGAIVDQVRRPLVLGHLPVRQLAVGHAVLSDVGRVALSVDGNRLQGAYALRTAQCRGGVGEQLPLGGRPPAPHGGGQEQDNGNVAVHTTRHGASFEELTLALHPVACSGHAAAGVAPR